MLRCESADSDSISPSLKIVLEIGALEDLNPTLTTISSLFTGFTTDGEFNSLRTMGNVRPIFIAELIKTARSSARTMKFTVAKKFFEVNAQGLFFSIAA